MSEMANYANHRGEIEASGCSGYTQVTCRERMMSEIRFFALKDEIPSVLEALQRWFRFHGHSALNESRNRLRVHEHIGPEGANLSSADAPIITRFRAITRSCQLAKNLQCPHANHYECDHRPADSQFQYNRHGAPPTLEFLDFPGSQRTPIEACKVPMPRICCSFVATI
jgi:hypothetical protein